MLTPVSVPGLPAGLVTVISMTEVPPAAISAGVKLFVDSFPAADHCLVVARTTPGSKGAQGLTLFIVDARSKGISQTPLVTLAKDQQSEVTFKAVRVPMANVIGTAGAAWPIVERMLDRGTALLCAQMVGATRKDIEMAIEYAKFREAFGQPIGAFQSHCAAHSCNGVNDESDGFVWKRVLSGVQGNNLFY